jgi:hypothetical protein
MNSTQARIPEDLGPGTEHGSGLVTYGQHDLPQVVIPPRRERDPALPANVVSDPGPGLGCQRCAGIPDPVLTPLREAMAQAAEAAARL